jgi:hypothetical protein
MTRKTTRTRAEAKKLMWEHYKERKQELSKMVRNSREQIIAEIMSGQTAELAFRGSTKETQSTSSNW